MQIGTIAAVQLLSIVFSVGVAAQTPYYQGKTIKLIQGR
jgi:hypothetical protein